MKKIIYLTVLVLVGFNMAFGQKTFNKENDKCGFDSLEYMRMHKILGDHWGYGYDSLLIDIAQWELNDNIQIQSIGQSTQGREMYELTITNFDVTKTLKHRIYMHVRTHPGEVQSFRVAREVINYLSNDSEIGVFLRDSCIFHIIPMYNPDGVELEYPRENANHVDLESNWNEEFPEIEVVNIRNRFSELMLLENPIEIALNMHSAVACLRYFVYHHQNGTSLLYTGMEQDFIGSVREHFLEGIEPYNYFVSWTSGTPNHYPESWWWLNYQEQVIALTYEDMNCDAAGFFPKTAYAILHGISDYLGLGFVGIPEELSKNGLEINAFPNPFTNQVNLEWNNFKLPDNAMVTDVFGKQIYSFSKAEISNNLITWSGINNNGQVMPSGIYFLNLIVGNQNKCIKLIKQ